MIITNVDRTNFFSVASHYIITESNRRNGPGVMDDAKRMVASLLVGGAVGGAMAYTLMQREAIQASSSSCCCDEALRRG